MAVISEPSRFLASLICFAVAYSAMAYTDLSTDATALLAFRARLLDDSSSYLNWSDYTTSFVCSWTGVTCGVRHRRITGIDLSDMGLAGSLPPEMGNLSFLVSLNLTKNRFNGDLPQELSRLRRLRFMDLGANQLSGEFPSWIGMLNELRILHLHNNSFTGSVPHSLGNASKLERFGLMLNEIEGSIPTSIFNLSNLLYLNLYGNKISGTLPSHMCSGIPNIEIFYLRDNQLEGEIPSNISACSQLQWINLSQNKFTGSIPADMSSPHSRLGKIFLFSNDLVGELPRSIGEWTMLEMLEVDQNGITGTIPIGLTNLTNLVDLSLSFNNITGTIPKEMGRLGKLERLNLAYNSLTGDIPGDIIFNISSLRIFSISKNKLTGRLPSNFCSGLPNLVELYLDRNEFCGEVPYSISNCTNLRLLDIGGNNFGGIIPHSIGDMRFLERVILKLNGFVCESTGCSFITSLAKCPHLRELLLENNNFHASIPNTVGNLSTSLEYFSCANSSIEGTIPEEFGNLTNLLLLSLASNNLMGSIPSTIGKLRNLQALSLSYNSLGGFIPDAICTLDRSSIIYLAGNQISGSIPACIGNLTGLREFAVPNNKLESTIPSSLWQLKDILMLDLSVNTLHGSLPFDIGKLNVAYLFDLSENRLSGAIPASVGEMQGLSYLSLAYNEFDGLIPISIGNISSLEQVNLSHNHLSGHIPMALEGISGLACFDVSFNNLSGRIPSEGSFRNFSYLYFESNEGLCGESRFPVHPCKVMNHGSHKRKAMLLVVCVLSSTLMICFAFILACKWCSRFTKSDLVQDGLNPIQGMTPDRISYHEIVRATENFSSHHLCGTGAFGSVYKGILQNGKVFAVKVFNLQRELAPRSFDVECELFRNLRHKNLCKVISVCSNNDFKALIIEYMSNGSLENWLYGQNQSLGIMQRFSIMIDIASAIEYLHHGYTVPIAHCDIKPSNILLDDDMVAHLSDFGIAKLLGNTDSFVHTSTFATMGYIAPEYGSEGLVSTRCDIYSFGIVLMEVFTRKRPTDEGFRGDLTLRSLVRDSISDKITEIVDLKLLHLDEVEDFTTKLECISSVFELSLKCSAEDPNERMTMNNVVATLKRIFSRLSRNTHRS